MPGTTTTPPLPSSPAGSVTGTVTSRIALVVFPAPEMKGRTVVSADHGTHVTVECYIAGQVQYRNGTPDSTWLRVTVAGKKGYVPIGQIDTGGDAKAQVPACQ
ncbi:hypothetical protein [Yinghuangia aomiensis]|uniref:hypothetical protein n=1 Tax=Yinghuangia aomiensis TaxID=676205 RepID=UPI0031F028E1